MRTIAGKSPLTVIGAFLLLLCGAAAPATQTPKSQEGSNGDLSVYAEAGLSQPAPAGQTAQAEASIEPSTDSSYKLVEFMSRVRGKVSTSHSGEENGRPLALDLWSSRIEVAEAKNDAEGRLALQSLIEQVRSMKFEDRTPAPARMPPVEPQPTPASPSAPEDSQRMKPQKTPRVVPAASESASPLSAKSLRTLAALQQNPGQAKDPLAMAELLFLSGRATEAIPFYRKALEQARPDDPASAADRAWILFQLGNCLRESDMAEAQEMYVKLIAEHPGSPWTELAKAHGRLLTWHQQDRPRELVASRQP